MYCIHHTKCIINKFKKRIKVYINTNITLVNHKIIKQLETKFIENPSLFKTISRVNSKLLNII